MTDQPTPTPLKLTDEMIAGIIANLWQSHPSATAVADFETAIRAMRDRARAVVDRYTTDYGICGEEGCEVCPTISALDEVLPEAKP